MSIVCKCDRCDVTDNKTKPGSEDKDEAGQPIPGTAKKYVLHDLRGNPRDHSTIVVEKNICELCLADLQTVWLKENLKR